MLLYFRFFRICTTGPKTCVGRPSQNCVTRGGSFRSGEVVCLSFRDSHDHIFSSYIHGENPQIKYLRCARELGLLGSKGYLIKFDERCSKICSSTRTRAAPPQCCIINVGFSKYCLLIYCGTQTYCPVSG